MWKLPQILEIFEDTSNFFNESLFIRKPLTNFCAKLLKTCTNCAYIGDTYIRQMQGTLEKGIRIILFSNQMYYKIRKSYVLSFCKE